DAVEDAVLPGRGPRAARLRLIAPGDRRERPDDAERQRDEGRRAGTVPAEAEVEHDAAEKRRVDHRVAGDVEQVPEARLGEAEPRDLPVDAVEHARKDEAEGGGDRRERATEREERA